MSVQRGLQTQFSAAMAEAGRVRDENRRLAEYMLTLEARSGPPAPVALLWTYLGSTKTLVNVYESEADARAEAERLNHYHWVQVIPPVPVSRPLLEVCPRCEGLLPPYERHGNRLRAFCGVPSHWPEGQCPTPDTPA